MTKASKWSFNYIAITNSPEEAKVLDACGVPQIMVDIEIIGKVERQKGKNTIISDHQVEDVKVLKALNLNAQIICRINPYYEGIRSEIDHAIEYGADIIMVPMITNFSQFEEMCKMINRRCAILPLIETPYSLLKLGDIIEAGSIKQIHFGLNDLFLALGMINLFEVMLSPVFAEIVKWTSERVPLVGVGGIGDPNKANKVDPLYLLDQHKSINSKSVILSRSFFENGYDESRIISSLQTLEERIQSKDEPVALEELRRQVYAM